MQTTKCYKIVMCRKLSILGMLFHWELQSYSREHKQNAKPERNRQEAIGIIKCCKDFHLHEKFLISSAYSSFRTNRKAFGWNVKTIKMSVNCKFQSKIYFKLFKIYILTLNSLLYPSLKPVVEEIVRYYT